MKNNIAAIYLRVSTDSQTEYSPEAQLKAIKEYAKKHDLEIDPNYIYRDEGISGRKAEKRPAFMQMIATAKTKPHSPFSKILVHKFDRFARNREDSVVYKSLLKKECNVEVVSITEDFGEDKFSVILEAMLEAMAEYYSLNLSDEVYKGMTEKAKRGEFQSKAPYGYDMINKNLVINEEEAKVVKMIYADFINGSPIQKITKKLNDMKILNKNKNTFEVRTVKYILRNPTYINSIWWCPGSKDSWDYKYRDKNSIKVDGKYEAIIDRETFDKVQEKLRANADKFNHIHEETKQHWLRKLVKCSTCSGTLSMSSKGLQCINYAHGRCQDSHFVKLEKIIDAILNQIKKDFTLPVNLNILKVNSNNNENELEIIKNKIDNINSKLMRCKNLYLEGIDTIDEYKENKAHLSEELCTLNKQYECLKDVPLSDDNADFSLKTKNLYEMLMNENVDMDLKYTSVHSLIDKIVYDKKEETIEIYYKN